jgi:hypothetical protein
MEYLPGGQQARKAWSDLVREANEVQGGKEVKSLPQSRFDGLQSKYRGHGLEKHALFGNHLLVRKVCGLCVTLLDEGRLRQLRKVSQELGLDKMTDAQILHMLKILSDTFFKYGSLLVEKGEDPRSWEMWVGMDTWFGAATMGEEGADDAIWDDIKEWTNPDAKDFPQWDDRRALMREGMELMKTKRLDFSGAKGWSMDEFIARPSEWIANGASTGHGIEGTRKTKVSMLLKEGTAGIKNLLMDATVPQYDAYIKSERKKNRGTISAMDSIWIQMAFVFPGLARAINSVFPTSLVGGVKLEQWMSWSRRMCQKTAVAMPLDQSKFDHIPTSGEVADVVQWMVTQARRMSGWSPEQEYVSELLVWKLREGGTIKYRGAKKTISSRVTHGILSGWYITATLDTVFNGMEYLAICKRAGMIPRMTADEVCFQGDDINKVGGNYHESCCLAEEYAKVLNVHPSKFFIDVERGEFLRNTFGWDARKNVAYRCGYLARSLPSMFYAQRWSQGMMNARSIVNSWSDLASRSGNLKACLEHCRRDLFGYFKGRVSLKDIDDWMSTPTPAGGAGVLNWRLGQRLVSCTEQKLGLRKNEYEAGLFKTELSDLPAGGKLVANRFGREIRDAIPDLKNASPSDIVDTLVGATHLKNKKQETQQELKPALPIDFSSAGGHRIVPPRPKVKIDPIYSSPVLRRMAQDGNLEGICELVESSDAARVRLYHRLWSRNVWISWLLGELPSDNLSTFGVANDVCASVKIPMAWPSGRVSMARVRGCAAYAAIRSRARLSMSSHLVEMRA